MEAISSINNLPKLGRDLPKQTHNGASRPPDLSYEKEIDQLFLWIKTWNEIQHNKAIETCLKRCSLSQLRMLWTILEPLMHRDFIYHNFDIKPDSPFSSLSTYVTRELYPRLEKTVNKNYKRGRRDLGIHRISSSHIVNEDDARSWANRSVLPGLKSSHPFLSDEPFSRKSSNTSSESVSPRRFSGVRPSEQNFMDQIRNKKKAQLATSNKGPSISETNVGVFSDFPIGLQTVRRHIQDVEITKFSTSPVEKEFISSHDKSHTRMTKKSTCPPCEPKKQIKKKAGLDVKDEVFNYQLINLTRWFSKWTALQQEHFLHRYLRLLQKVHLFLMYALIMVRLYCDYISLLPEALSLNILSYFTPKELDLLSKVNTKWELRTSHDVLWSKICSRKNIVRKAAIAYKDVYLKYKETKLNWTEGRHSTKEYRGHTASVTAVRFLDNVIVSGSADRTIRVWDMNLKKCQKVLEGHQKSVWGLRFLSKSLLVSCSGDATVKIWNLKSGECTRTIMGHEGAVWCIQIKQNYLISGAADKTAKIWNLRNCSLFATFSGHPGSVFSVDMNDDCNQLFTGSIEGWVRIWDVKTHNQLSSFQVGNQTEAPVNGLDFSGGFLLCSCNTTLQLWDVELLEMVKGREAHSEKIESIQLQIMHKKKGLKGKYVSAGKDGRIKLWTLLSKKVIQSLQVHEDAVTCIQFSDSLIVSASADATIKVLDFSDPPPPVNLPSKERDD